MNKPQLDVRIDREKAATLGISATDIADMSRRLALMWGVVPVLTDLSGDVNEAATRIGDVVARGCAMRSPPASPVRGVPGRHPDRARPLERVRDGGFDGPRADIRPRPAGSA